METGIETNPPPARPSSTVVLVREGVDAPEYLLLRRHASTAFGDAYAFAGGVVDDADLAVEKYCAGLSAAAADRVLDVDRHGLGFYSAAVRELFEETGVLLADGAVEVEELDAARDRLNRGELCWDAFVSDNDILLRCDVLHYIGFWITPLALPKRYSTRFFLATLPEGQAASHCGGEITDSCWLTAAEAVEAARAGTIKLHHPTRETLLQLSEHASLDEAVSWAQSRAQTGVPRILAEFRIVDGRKRIFVNGEDVTEQRQ